jgi:hypothetical protein
VRCVCNAGTTVRGDAERRRATGLASATGMTFAPLEKLRTAWRESRRSRPSPELDWSARLDYAGFAALTEAHETLLQRYAGILAFSMPLPAFIPWRVSKSGSRPWWFPKKLWVATPQKERWILQAYGALFSRILTPRALVQPFVESHITRRLAQLERVYLYASDHNTASSASATRRATWFERARADLTEHASAVSPWNSWKSLARVFGIPTVASAVALLGDTDRDTLTNVAIVAGILAVYGALFGSTAFQYKRSLFLGTPGVAKEAPKDTRLNAYLAEDHVWELLQLTKRLEPALDKILLAGAVWGFGGLFLGVGVADRNAYMLILGASLLLVGIIGLIQILFRKWR